MPLEYKAPLNVNLKKLKSREYEAPHGNLEILSKYKALLTGRCSGVCEKNGVKRIRTQPPWDF